MKWFDNFNLEDEEPSGSAKKFEDEEDLQYNNNSKKYSLSSLKYSPHSDLHIAVDSFGFHVFHSSYVYSTKAHEPANQNEAFVHSFTCFIFLKFKSKPLFFKREFFLFTDKKTFAKVFLLNLF